LGGGTAFASGVLSAYGFGSVIADFAFNTSGIYDAVLAARLDARPGQELVTLAPFPNQAGTNVTMLGWSSGGFRRFAQTRLALGYAKPAAGDVDGDGRDEVLLDRQNRLVTLRLVEGRLVTSRAAAPFGDRMIAALSVCDVRRRGVFELLAALDSRQSFRSEAEPRPDTLIGLRLQQGRWIRAWRAPLQMQGYWLALHAGNFHPAFGNELVFEHDPSDVSAALYEAWRGNGSRLSRLASHVADSQKSTGLQSWVGASPQLIRLGTAAPTIATQTTYLPPDGMGEGDMRGELLVWQGTRLRAAYRLPGEPKAVADLRGTGSAVVIVYQKGKGLVALEATSR
jgi:hypothetical protein